MKIWLFNHYAVPPTLYPLARTCNFAKFLIKAGHEVKIFAASTVHNSNINLIDNHDNYKEETVESIDYIYLKTNKYKTNGLDRIVNMFQYTFRLFQVTKHFTKPDIILASSVHPLTCVAGILIAKRYKCKCIAEIADLWPQTLIDFGIINKKGVVAKVLYKLEHWIYKNADQIIFTMEGGKNYVIDTFGNYNDIDTNKIHYINNGIDIDKFNKDKVDNQYNDEDLDNKYTYKVVYTGSLGEANAANFIFEAADVIQQKGFSDIKFIIFGSGAKKPELEEYCKTHNLTNVVFKGKVDKKYIPNILSKSDLNIFTGRNFHIYKYGLSLNKMFDYMASGKPTISNIMCGFDNLEKFQCGITVHGENADCLANGIISIYKMPVEESNQFCANALMAAKNFDFKSHTEQLEKIIQKTIENN